MRNSYKSSHFFTFMITGKLAAIHGSPKGFIFVLEGPKGIVQIDMDFVAAQEFAKQFKIEEDDSKELLRALSKKVFNKEVKISIA